MTEYTPKLSRWAAALPVVYDRAGFTVNALGWGTVGFVAGAGTAGIGGALLGGTELTTLGIASGPVVTPLLPAVPSAIDKLQGLGISLQEANGIITSPGVQKFIDNANSGNINVFREIGDKIIRVTLDPTGSRIISAGIVQSRNIRNSIASGRFTPVR